LRLGYLLLSHIFTAASRTLGPLAPCSNSHWRAYGRPQEDKVHPWSLQETTASKVPMDANQQENLPGEQHGSRENGKHTKEGVADIALPVNVADNEGDVHEPEGPWWRRRTWRAYSNDAACLAGFALMTV
jgi:hypothetical protein